MSKFIPNSFQVPNAFVDECLKSLSGNAVKCYLFIARKTTGWQKSADRISTVQFMEVCGIKDRKTAFAVIDELEKIGLISVVRSKGEINEFSLNFDIHDDIKNDEKINNSVPVPKNGTSTKNSSAPVPKNGTSTSTKNWDSTKDNIKNNITNKKDLTYVKSKKATKKPTALALLAEFGITDQLAEDFIEQRKAKKAPITQTVLKRLQTQADIAKLPLAEVVAIMIDRNWTGFNANWDWRGESQFSGRAEPSSKPKFSDENTTWWKGRTIEIYGDTL